MRGEDKSVSFSEVERVQKKSRLTSSDDPIRSWCDSLSIEAVSDATSKMTKASESNAFKQADSLLGESSHPSNKPTNLPTMIPGERDQTELSSDTMEVDYWVGGGPAIEAEPVCCVIEGMSLLCVS